MTCSKLLLLYVGLYGLAFFISINEARPTEGNGGDGDAGGSENAGRHSGGSSPLEMEYLRAAFGDIKAQLRRLSKQQLGKLAAALPNDKFGKLIRGYPDHIAGSGIHLAPKDALAKVFGQLPKRDFQNGLQVYTDSQLKDIIDGLSSTDLEGIYGSEAGEVPNLSGATLRKKLLKRPSDGQASFDLDVTSSQVGKVYKGFPLSHIGKAAHEITESQLEYINAYDLDKLIDVLSSDELEDLLGSIGGLGGIGKHQGGIKDIIRGLNKKQIEYVVNALNDDTVGKIVRNLPVSDVGSGIKGLSKKRLRQLAKLVPQADKGLQVVTLTASGEKVNLKDIPSDDLEYIFGTDLNSLLSKSTEEFKSIINNLAPAKLAVLAKDTRNSSVGTAFDGLTTSEMGRAIHSLSPSELAKVFRKIPTEKLLAAIEELGVGGNCGSTGK